MRGIERVLALVLLVAAVGGATLSSRYLARESASEQPIQFATPPPLVAAAGHAVHAAPLPPKPAPKPKPAPAVHEAPPVSRPIVVAPVPAAPRPLPAAAPVRPAPPKPAAAPAPTPPPPRILAAAPPAAAPPAAAPQPEHVPNGHAWGWWRNHGQAPDPSTTAPPIVDDEGDVELSPGRGEGHDHGHGHGNESGD